jgi:hypothetical protein
MIPISEAPLGQYVLGYYAGRNRHDNGSDPNYVVIKLMRHDAPDCRGGQKYWASFGPSKFAYEQIAGWWPLPSF